MTKNIALFMQHQTCLHGFPRFEAYLQPPLSDAEVVEENPMETEIEHEEVDDDLVVTARLHEIVVSEELWISLSRLEIFG